MSTREANHDIIYKALEIKVNALHYDGVNRRLR